MRLGMICFEPATPDFSADCCSVHAAGCKLRHGQPSRQRTIAKVRSWPASATAMAASLLLALQARKLGVDFTLADST